MSTSDRVIEIAVVEHEGEKLFSVNNNGVPFFFDALYTHWYAPRTEDRALSDADYYTGVIVVRREGHDVDSGALMWAEPIIGRHCVEDIYFLGLQQILPPQGDGTRFEISQSLLPKWFLPGDIVVLTLHNVHPDPEFNFVAQMRENAKLHVDAPYRLPLKEDESAVSYWKRLAAWFLRSRRFNKAEWAKIDAGNVLRLRALHERGCQE